MVKATTRRRQGGAAILLALLIMTLVATLAAGMVWLQWRGIEVESAERARGQGEWLLNASLDWGNLILKSSIRNGDPDDDLGQPWATPLSETKLSSFLSADGSHSDDSGPEAYLSGQITDAQSKYNLYNLLVDGAGKTAELQRLQILCTAIGVSPDVASTIAAGIRASYSAQQQIIATPGQADANNSVVMPIQVADLAWYGIDPKVIKMLEPFVQIIPFSGITPATVATPINANTAPAEVLMAGYGLPAITRAQAAQLILQRQQKPLDSPQAITSALGLPNAVQQVPTGAPGNILDFRSHYFEVYGQLRYEQHVIRERSVVFRQGPFDPIQVLRRERLPPDAT
jgi:general secretion pathway protein K